MVGRRRRLIRRELHVLTQLLAIFLLLLEDLNLLFRIDVTVSSCGRMLILWRDGLLFAFFVGAMPFNVQFNSGHLVWLL